MTCQWPSFGKSIVCRSCLWGNRVFSIMCCTALSACIDQDYWQNIKLRHNSPFFQRLPRHPHFPSSTWNMVDLVNATQERGHCSRIYKDSSTRQGSGFFLRKHAIFSSPPSLQNDRNEPKKSVGTRQQRHWCTRSVKQATLHNPMFSFDLPAFSLDGLMFSYKCFPTFSHHWNCNFCHDLQLQTFKVCCFFCQCPAVSFCP